MTDDWIKKLQFGLASPEKPLDALVDDFSAVLSAEFGIELNPDDIHKDNLDVEAEWDDELGKVRYALRDYVKDWLLDSLVQRQTGLRITSDESPESLDTLATELLGLKTDLQNNELLARENNTQMLIADNETVASMCARLKRVLKPLQDQLLAPLGQQRSLE